MTNATPEARDAYAYIDDFATLDQVREEMQKLDGVPDRTQAGYGYMRLIERVTGGGPAAPEKPGMMAQQGAVEALEALRDRIARISAPEVDEMLRTYQRFVSERISRALAAPRKAEEAAEDIYRETYGGWTGR